MSLKYADIEISLHALQGASNVARLIWQRRKQLRRRGEQLYLLLENKKYVLIVPEQKRASLIMTTHCSS
jgi:hypothetical protein